MLGHGTEKNTRDLSSTARSDDQQGRTVADVDEHIASRAVSDLAFAYERVIESTGVGQGLVHDRRASLLVVRLEENRRPRGDVGGRSVGAHDMKDGTSERGLVSSKCEGSRATFGPIDADDDPELAVIAPCALAAHRCSHTAIMPGQAGYELGT